ncbi:sensor histidine kinase [Demequina litorisediminis]|nr:ATP-binding protein [Demequina litorisediminis]
MSAGDALASIAALATPEHERDGGYSAAEVVAALRAVPADLGVDAHVDYSFGTCPPVPGDAVAALSEALGEAVRNAARHAGDEARLSVSISADHRGVDILVADRGVGFDPEAVDPLRLGIRVSIRDRMSTVDGGRGAVYSRPGRGTTVQARVGRPMSIPTNLAEGSATSGGRLLPMNRPGRRRSSSACSSSPTHCLRWAPRASPTGRGRRISPCWSRATARWSS